MRRTDYNKRSIKDEETTVEDLPGAILIDILSRLPIKTIFHRRYVCKTWLSLLLHPHFAKIHLTRAPSTPSSLVLRSRISRGKGKPKNLSLVDREAADLCDRNARIKLNSAHLDFLTSWDYKVENSCNGFIYLRDCRFEFSFYILNPLTGEYITIPPPHKKSNSISQLGFCSKTNEYKLLRFPTKSMEQGEIYTLGTASWRSTVSLPCPCVRDKYSDGFLNGYFHWVGYDNSDVIIFSFDFTNETIQPVPPPVKVHPNLNSVTYIMGTGVLDGSLCIFGRFSDDLDIRIMREYGIQESWTKQFSIPLEYAWMMTTFYVPVKLLSDGAILLLELYHWGSKLVSYNFGKMSFEDFKIHGTGSEYSASFFHVPSFVSLRDIAMGENLEVLNVKQRETQLTATEVPISSRGIQAHVSSQANTAATVGAQQTLLHDSPEVLDTAFSSTSASISSPTSISSPLVNPSSPLTILPDSGLILPAASDGYKDDTDEENKPNLEMQSRSMQAHVSSPTNTAASLRAQTQTLSKDSLIPGMDGVTLVPTIEAALPLSNKTPFSAPQIVPVSSQSQIVCSGPSTAATTLPHPCLVPEVNVRGYLTPVSSAAMVEKIFDKYGDFMAHCSFESPSLLRYAFDSVLKITLKLTTNIKMPMYELETDKKVLRDLEKNGVKVDWLLGCMDSAALRMRHIEAVTKLDFLNKRVADVIAERDAAILDVETARAVLPEGTNVAGPLGANLLS